MVYTENMKISTKLFPVAILLFISLYQAKSQVTTYDAFSAFEEEVLSPYNSDTLYVINFWATWCKPCVKELPYFETLKEQYLDIPIKVVLVSLDMKKQVPTVVEPFLNKNKIKSKVVVLADGRANSWIDKVDPEWSGAIPATVLLYGQASTFYEKSYHTTAELESDIIKILNKNK